MLDGVLCDAARDGVVECPTLPFSASNNDGVCLPLILPFSPLGFPLSSATIFSKGVLSISLDARASGRALRPSLLFSLALGQLFSPFSPMGLRGQPGVSGI